MILKSLKKTPDDPEKPLKSLCTEDEVYELLSNLDITKANGPDDISARMLKETALSITPIVTHLISCHTYESSYSFYHSSWV